MLSDDDDDNDDYDDNGKVRDLTHSIPWQHQQTHVYVSFSYSSDQNKNAENFSIFIFTFVVENDISQEEERWLDSEAVEGR